ncbi:MAG: S8 family peptidase [Candidatus Riflebacteria bacterium]|nr:S8 family peptidase [Candidatus Riflebacteria bacterium]
MTLFPQAPWKKISHGVFFFISSGNIYLQKASEYPDQNILESVQDPSQAWNAISVGGYTDRCVFDHAKHPGFAPLAHQGGLSPASSTSVNWEKTFPIKPDIVMEGGNCIYDSSNGEIRNIPDLELLTTNANFRSQLFSTMGDTSAATALAARFGAQLQNEYPDLWPETLRGLIIHSAEWSSEMLFHKKLFDIPKKNKWPEILRTFGYGVPQLEKALFSKSNSVTLVFQDEIQPFFLDGSEIKTNEVRFHELPWPITLLQEHMAGNAFLKITLSYFVEPNPGSRLINAYRYPSCTLNFDICRATESHSDFKKRINKLAREGKEYKTLSASETDNWVLGTNLRGQGSVKKDIWKGSAAEVAPKGQIAVFPGNGWWRLRKALKKYNSITRYSLIVSLTLPKQEIDIYTPISQMIQTKIPIMYESKK